jgi:hypothetical protein
MLFMTFVDSTIWQVTVWLDFVAERCSQMIEYCAFAVNLF